MRHIVIKRDPLVAQAVENLVQLTGWAPWFAKNIVLWRLSRRLPVQVSKTL